MAPTTDPPPITTPLASSMPPPNSEPARVGRTYWRIMTFMKSGKTVTKLVKESFEERKARLGGDFIFYVPTTVDVEYEACSAPQKRRPTRQLCPDSAWKSSKVGKHGLSEALTLSSPVISTAITAKRIAEEKEKEMRDLNICLDAKNARLAIIEADEEESKKKAKGDLEVKEKEIRELKAYILKADAEKKTAEETARTTMAQKAQVIQQLEARWATLESQKKLSEDSDKVDLDIKEQQNQALRTSLGNAQSEKQTSEVGYQATIQNLHNMVNNVQWDKQASEVGYQATIQDLHNMVNNLQHEKQLHEQSFNHQLHQMEEEKKQAIEAVNLDAINSNDKFAQEANKIFNEQEKIHTRVVQMKQQEYDNLRKAKDVADKQYLDSVADGIEEKKLSASLLQENATLASINNNLGEDKKRLQLQLEKEAEEIRNRDAMIRELRGEIDDWTSRIAGDELRHQTKEAEYLAELNQKDLDIEEMKKTHEAALTAKVHKHRTELAKAAQRSQELLNEKQKFFDANQAWFALTVNELRKRDASTQLEELLQNPIVAGSLTPRESHEVLMEDDDRCDNLRTEMLMHSSNLEPSEEIDEGFGGFKAERATSLFRAGNMQQLKVKQLCQVVLPSIDGGVVYIAVRGNTLAKIQLSRHDLTPSMCERVLMFQDGVETELFTKLVVYACLPECQVAAANLILEGTDDSGLKSNARGFLCKMAEANKGKLPVCHEEKSDKKTFDKAVGCLAGVGGFQYLLGVVATGKITLIKGMSVWPAQSHEVSYQHTALYMHDVQLVYETKEKVIKDTKLTAQLDVLTASLSGFDGLDKEAMAEDIMKNLKTADRKAKTLPLQEKPKVALNFLNARKNSSSSSEFGKPIAQTGDKKFSIGKTVPKKTKPVAVVKTKAPSGLDAMFSMPSLGSTKPIVEDMLAQQIAKEEFDWSTLSETDAKGKSKLPLMFPGGKDALRHDADNTMTGIEGKSKEDFGVASALRQ